MKENIYCCMKPGYSFVIPTEFEDLYDIEDALCHGTLFRQLNLTIKEYGKCRRDLNGKHEC